MVPTLILIGIIICVLAIGYIALKSMYEADELPTRLSAQATQTMMCETDKACALECLEATQERLKNMRYNVSSAQDVDPDQEYFAMKICLLSHSNDIDVIINSLNLAKKYLIKERKS